MEEKVRGEGYMKGKVKGEGYMDGKGMWGG